MRLTDLSAIHLNISDYNAPSMLRSMDIASYATAVKRGHHTKFSSSEKYEVASFELLDADFLADELKNIMKEKRKITPTFISI